MEVDLTIINNTTKAGEEMSTIYISDPGLILYGLSAFR